MVMNFVFLVNWHYIFCDARSISYFTCGSQLVAFHYLPPTLRRFKHKFCVFFRTLPKISREDFELIFDELDDSHDIKVIFVLLCFGYLLCTY